MEGVAEGDEAVAAGKGLQEGGDGGREGGGRGASLTGDKAAARVGVCVCWGGGGHGSLRGGGNSGRKGSLEGGAGIEDDAGEVAGWNRAMALEGAVVGLCSS